MSKTVTIKLEEDIYQYLKDYADADLHCDADSAEELISDLCREFVHDHMEGLR